ncbi:hypothetical protein Hanom_Chr14g01247021 [Helianthus anomalus]
MCHSGKIHNHPKLSLLFAETTYQISGRNFFQVGDDVTTRNFKSLFPCSNPLSRFVF